MKPVVVASWISKRDGLFYVCAELVPSGEPFEPIPFETEAEAMRALKEFRSCALIPEVKKGDA